MASNPMQSLTSTLSIQPVQPDQEASQQQAQAGTDVSANDVQEPVTDAAIAAPSESTPTKRGPGRPKGSGVKTKYIDPNAPPPLKRPVGRPRKDGLPAGSVPRPNAISTRKRRVAAPGEFAVAAGDVHSNQATPQASASAPPYPGPQLNYAQYVYPTTNAATPQPTWQTGYSTLSAALQVDLPAPRRETASVPVGRIARESHSIDPNLAEDDWAVLMRTDRTALLHNLVTALYAPNPLSATGQPIEMAFRFHIDRLAPLPDAPPNLTAYSTLRTYWLPSSPAYFSLFASSSKTPTPPEYRFFYWDPHHLALMGIACPHCSAPLINKGCIRSGAIKVHDIGKPFFIIGCEYVCQSAACKAVSSSTDGRRFGSTDPAVMRSLPQILRNEFPAKLLDHTLDNAWNWEAIGVSKTLWDMVCIGLGAGLGREALLQILRGTQEEASGAVTGKPEEDEERAVEMDLQHPDDADADGSPAHETHKEALPQSYTTTWKPHAAVEDHSMNGQQPEASTSSAAASSSVAVAPPPQGSLGTIPPVYGYLQGAPYMQSAYGPYPYIYQHADPNVPGPSTSSKRAGEALSVEPPSKRIRHCVKCGSKDCKGKGGRNFCTNACQDCGKMECKGRNSKRPDKTCIDAWQ